MLEDKLKSKYELVLVTKLAQQTQRYEQMAHFARRLLTSEEELTSAERNLCASAYKNLVNNRRAELKVLHAIEKKLTGKEAKEMTVALDTYRKTIEDELIRTCVEVIKVIEEQIVPAKVQIKSIEAKVFYLKMRGDFYRYLCEVDDGDQTYFSKASDCYEEADTLARGNLPPTNEVRLSLHLNMSVFLYERCGEVEKALDLANRAFDEAVANLQELYHDFAVDQGQHKLVVVGSGKLIGEYFGSLKWTRDATLPPSSATPTASSRGLTCRPSSRGAGMGRASSSTTCPDLRPRYCPSTSNTRNSRLSSGRYPAPQQVYLLSLTFVDQSQLNMYGFHKQRHPTSDNYFQHETFRKGHNLAEVRRKPEKKKKNEEETARIMTDQLIGAEEGREQGGKNWYSEGQIVADRADDDAESAGQDMRQEQQRQLADVPEVAVNNTCSLNVLCEQAVLQNQILTRMQPLLISHSLKLRKLKLTRVLKEPSTVESSTQLQQQVTSGQLLTSLCDLLRAQTHKLQSFL